MATFITTAVRTSNHDVLFRKLPVGSGVDGEHKRDRFTDRI
jgi:hypothetical protein